MGNTPSGEVEGKDKYIEEQKRIILEQQEQIQRLANLAEGGIKEKPKINPYHELEIGENYDENSLKKAYLKKAMVTHPDRGGSQEAFQRVTISYKALMIKLKNEQNAHEHNELRGNSSQFMEEQRHENRQNVNTDLSKNFNSTKFNQIYEENRIEDVNDEGYGGWMKEEIQNQTPESNPSLTKDNFNDHFVKYKRENQSKMGDQMVEYSEPQVDISYKNKSSIMVLGQGKVDDFSGESGGLSYRDYKDAYTNTYLVDESKVKQRGDRPSNIKKLQHERKNVSYEMSEQDQQIYALKQIQEEQEEKLRLERLANYEAKAFNIYDQVHKRMVGHI